MFMKDDLNLLKGVANGRRFLEELHSIRGLANFPCIKGIHMVDNPCDDCQEPYCYYYEKCPDCLGSGISKRYAIGGINSPNFYGLQHPVGLDKLCPTCNGAKII